MDTLRAFLFKMYRIDEIATFNLDFIFEMYTVIHFKLVGNIEHNVLLKMSVLLILFQLFDNPTHIVFPLLLFKNIKLHGFIKSIKSVNPGCYFPSFQVCLGFVRLKKVAVPPCISWIHRSPKQIMRRRCILQKVYSPIKRLNTVKLQVSKVISTIQELEFQYILVHNIRII